MTSIMTGVVAVLLTIAVYGIFLRNGTASYYEDDTAKVLLYLPVDAKVKPAAGVLHFDIERDHTVIGRISFECSVLDDADFEEVKVDGYNGTRATRHDEIIYCLENKENSGEFAVIRFALGEKPALSENEISSVMKRFRFT